MGFARRYDVLIGGGLMSGHGSINILIVDDQQITRLGLRLAAERSPDLVVVAEADEGSAAVSKTMEFHPDVVLMDIELPGMDGIEASRQIKSRAPDTRILIVTNYDNDEEIFAALSAGADGYCLKDAGCEQIAMAIRAVAAGAAWLSPGIARRVLATCRSDAGKGSAPESRESFLLSVRELDVLGLIVEGLSNLAIANRLCLSQETVKTHVRHIMEKLVVSDRTQAAVKALRQGLVGR
jgi:two-component system, NarL family, response regulator LiaR